MEKLELAKKYYTILDKSDTSAIKSLLEDSLYTRETEYDYEQTFSQQEYIAWLQWDSIFEPTYQILEIKEENGNVKARISKTDKRIDFLHEQPIVTDQVLRIEKNKITSIETTKYVVFNDSLFVANRDRFLNWIQANHPDAGGFINDQTKSGGIKYLNAMELYKSKE